MQCFSRRDLLRVAAASAVIGLGGEALASEPSILTFVLVNDIYKMNAQKGRGGTGKLAAVVRAERASKENVLFVHAGDTLSPSLMSGFDQGAHMIALFNAIQPDVFVPGNHEFDFGKVVYLKRVGEAKFPILAANLRQADGSPVPGHRDTLIIEKAGLRIGFVGATLETTPQISSPGDLQFAPALTTIKTQAEALRQAGADLVVAVVHADKLTGQRIMESGSVDLILSGHNHDLHLDYDGKTLLAESGEDGQFITAIDLSVAVKSEGNRHSVAWTPNFRIIDTLTITPDADQMALIERYERHLSSELDVELANLTLPLDSRSASVRGGEAAIGNLIADALRDATGAEIALINGGGIRASKEYPAGTKLTRRDILSELPFGNRTVVAEVAGRDLKEAIENGLSLVETHSGRFPQVAGLRILANASAPAGERLVQLQVNGQPVDDAKIYRVATNDFMLRGGDGYAALGRRTKASLDSGGALLANDVMAYCRKLGQIAAKIEGRIVLQ